MTGRPDAPGSIAPLPGAFTRVYSGVLPPPRPVQYNCPLSAQAGRA